MQYIVSLLLVVIVAGFAECRSSPLSLGKLRERLDELKTRKLETGARQLDGTTDSTGWIEFATLVSRCNTYNGWLALYNSEGFGSILDEVCPTILNLANILSTATEEELANEEWKIQTLFPLVQCTILKAEQEELAYIYDLMLSQNNTSYEPVEVQQMLDNCETVFADIPAILASLDEGVKRVEEDLLLSRRASRLDALLREFINASKRK